MAARTYNKSGGDKSDKRDTSKFFSNNVSAKTDKPFFTGSPPKIQAKLTIGNPGDQYEKEADAVAEQVVGISDTDIRSQPKTKRQHHKSVSVIQRLEEEIDPRTDVSPSLEGQIKSLNGGGQTLPVPSQDFFANRFGKDFSQIRIHTSPQAAKIARKLNARAFTTGRDVVFGSGEFSPTTSAGKKLIAHELTHVVQQGKAGNQSDVNSLIQRLATDPVVPVRTQISISAGVGRSRPNNVADVRLIQDRLRDLNFLSSADHTAESPAAGATGTVPEASLTATIAAIEAFQSEVQGHSSPDGRVDNSSGSNSTLANLNRAVPRPTAAQFTAVSTARTGITETVTRGVAITAPVGAVPNADVFAGNANRPADVNAVQTRLMQLGYLITAHGETPVVAPVTTPIVLTGSVGDSATNNVADVRQVQDRLLTLGHLSAADHATEQPATGATGTIPQASLTATIAAIRAFQDSVGFGTPDGNIGAGGMTNSLLNTDSVPSMALTRTKNAINSFQGEVRFFRSRGEVSGTVTNRVINLGDATIDLLNRIGSFSETFATGEVFNFRDFVRSRYTVHTGGISVIGTASPASLPVAEYTAVGLTPAQTNALRFVSSHEGNFDALNTYDIARVSFGFIQFAGGGRSLHIFMALLKSRNPTAFATMFQTFGIDVEFNVVGGDIRNAVIVVLDPATSRVLRGTPAETFIRDSQRLSAVFLRAGRNIEVQRVQIEAATRQYVLPPLAEQENFTADIVEVLASPGGAVTATHVGAAARAFRATPTFATLNGAGRIRERTVTTHERLENLLNSEQGIAVLVDRKIHEGNTLRVRFAMDWVADQQGLTDIAGIAAFEQEVLQQVVDDLTADIDISAMLERARTHLNTLHTAAGAAGATVAGVLANAAAGLARTEVDNAITDTPNKSPDPERTALASNLPTERARMNFTPPPATTAALRTLLNDIRSQLQGLKPDIRGNAAPYRRRIQDILGSSLAPPTAPAPAAPAPAPAPAPTP